MSANQRRFGYLIRRRTATASVPELQSTVLIAMTRYGQQEDRRRAFEAGFNFHMTKPADVSALEGMLLRLPERRALAASL